MDPEIVKQNQKESRKRYRQTYEEMRFRVTKEERDLIKNYCNEHNISVNQLVRDLIFKEINNTNSTN